MLELRFHVDQQRVTAAENERDVWFEGRKIGNRRIPPNPRRIQVRLVMMNPDERFTQRERLALRRLEPDH